MRNPSLAEGIFAAAIASLIALSGCGGSGEGSDTPPRPPAQTYSVGGTINGLAVGTSVVLLDNNGDALTVSADGNFTFSTALASGASYAITVGTEPTGQLCQVNNGLGTIGGANITNAVVSCTRAYTIGGTITGLDSATGLVLANGRDTFSVPANSKTFAMPTAVANGASYEVTVQAHPTLLNCTVISGAGTVTGADVSAVTVSCEQGTQSFLYSFAGPPTDGSYPNGSLLEAGDGNFYGVTMQGGANNYGIVFKLTPTGDQSTVYSFRASDGNPVGLMQASDGNFYGMTTGGTTNPGGSAFRVTPSGTETVLYSFDKEPDDGAYPIGSLIQGRDGNFYGVTSNGSRYMAGTVFKLTPNGTETVLHRFLENGPDGVYPTGSLIQANDGNFYGLTQMGGRNGPVGPGTIFKITPNGTETVLYFFEGGADGLQPVGSLIQASDGNLYGMTSMGGTGNFAYGGTVFKVTLSGTHTVVYSFGSGPTDGIRPGFLAKLVQASDGNFYGTTNEGGSSNNGIIFKITPDGTKTDLYSFIGDPTVRDISSSPLIQSRNGNLYGVTLTGGTSNLGTVFEFN